MTIDGDGSSGAGGGSGGGSGGGGGGEAAAEQTFYYVRTKALPFCCASTVFLAKAVPFIVVCLSQVLTYIPDLAWCRVARMRQNGVFGPDRERTAKGVTGRPRWVLEPEAAGAELDVSALRCVVQRSRAVRRTQDADKEEWDILDDPAVAAVAAAAAAVDAVDEAAGTAVSLELPAAAAAASAAAAAMLEDGGGRAQVTEDGWRFAGNAHIGQRVKGRWTTDAESEGTIVAWMPEGEPCF
eukprot:SAG22_NODE_277_length_13166_cov_134.125277_9_plen_240_part_00